jgi:hypothetical protein
MPATVRSVAAPEFTQPSHEASCVLSLVRVHRMPSAPGALISVAMQGIERFPGRYDDACIRYSASAL